MPTSNPTASSYNPGSAFSATSGYGTRDNPFRTGSTEYHPGQDYAAPAGTAIPAASSGAVVYSGYNAGGYGNTVVISLGTILSRHEPRLRNKNLAFANEIGELLIPGKLDLLKKHSKSFMRNNFGWDDKIFWKMYDSRNKPLASAISKLMKKKTPFIALVGASHLAGDEGILHLLKNEGFEILKK